MEEQITELFVSGFCKMQNQTRMVICEVEELQDGIRKLISSDCAYGRCEHTSDCQLMGQVCAADQNRQA